VGDDGGNFWSNGWGHQRKRRKDDLSIAGNHIK
jgi:hypothetical protein